MREQDHSARFRLTPIAAACMVAFVTACGGGGSGGGNGDDDTTTENGTTEGQTQAVATTTATQVSSAATGARTGSEAAEDFDEDALTGGQTALTSGLQERAQTLVDSGALAQQAGDDGCDSGTITVDENYTDGELQGTEFVANDCRIVADEDEIDLEFTIDGTQRVLADPATRDVKIDSDNFTASLDFSMDEIQDEDGNTIFPAVGPIEGDFESDGGYEASFSSNGDEFDMNMDWMLAFGMSCSGQGFNFAMESSDLEVTSADQGSGIWDTTVNGTVAWEMSADVWDVDIDEEVTYETVQPLSAVGAGQPDNGELNVDVGDQTVNLVYVQGGVEVDGEFYTHEELAEMHEEELGADLEQELLGSCVDGDFQI